ncbi:MAG TPA: transglycosylase SLT domain-containing protein [Gemmatimonadaceae bacterium]|nr:transglycosylase SLT domain-containing protein [Gemmatimonadaceae bacterium]
MRMAKANGTPPSRRKTMWKRIARDGGLAITLVAAIAYATTIVKPIYAGRAPVVGDVIRGVSNQPDQLPAPAMAIPTGPLADSVRLIESSPEFAEQKRRFAADLVATGRMSPERADSIAHFAVREAFLRGVPPAVIFGVMLTENAQFISRAKSNVGAVGLMQVYPKYWFKELSKKFEDPNIEADSTNLRYGVFILEHYLKPRGKKSTGEHVIATAPGSLMKGLLRYNGCVRGTNTPRCHTYPNKVQKFVERDAQALCGDQTFYQCIAQPFMAGLLGQRGAD